MVATIEYIERVIDTFAKAAKANTSPSTRRGNVIELTTDSAKEVMITADLHGHRKNFNQIRQIANLDGHPQRHLILQEVCHGGPTYPISGGCMSHQMLEDVAALKAKYPDRVHFLLSNHELAELTDYPIVKNGKMLNLMFRFGLQEMYGPATDKIREAFLGFLRTLPLAVRFPEGVWVSHTLPEKVDQRKFKTDIFDRPLRDDDLVEDSALFGFVWGRDYRQENADAFADVVQAEILIHGHEPSETGFATPNTRQVILDCTADRAKYVILPVGQRLTQEDVVGRIKPLAGR
ncbi:MAG: hypothetical protein DWQ31_16000 [Planctomycetota bacterium]|nr:MAG: hypothetical protein DWQ31_16000 [Planctomycetota bacterium]REJ89089.1 MAG: hypothetical protein DWQ35_18675 [Planctomycetota bacterium]REK24647.1 MAG: hypothetical protein DWQ42_13015 [Planctomycetota bacterium]REK40146.1 MAG: hypothetical protein DWQ46_16940 [Planctomycetota bacterium]